MSDLPDWARFFGTQERLDRFEEAILKDMEGRGIRVAIENGWVWPMDGSTTERWGLSNIGQRCAHEEESEWAGLVRRHFDAILETQLETEELDFSDFEGLKGRLSVRLWESEAIGEGRVCSRDDIPGLKTCLCVDLERGIRGISEEEAAELGRPVEELFEIAIRNSIEASEVEVRGVDLDGAEAIALLGESPYTSSHALRMERYAEHMGEHGAIIAIPLRDVIVILPFEDIGVAGQLHKVMLMAAGMYAEGPGSVTASVYWYRDGVWMDLPYALTEQSLDVMPPDEFVEYLNGLAPEGETDAGEEP
jgi:hypothetical protein